MASAPAPLALPPNSMAAEQAVLGALFLNNKLFDDISDALTTDQFHDPLHAAVFDAIASITRRGREATPITVRQALHNTPFNSDDALYPKLSGFFDHAAKPTDLVGLADIIRTAHNQRKMISLGDTLRQQAANSKSKQETLKLIQEASDALFSLGEGAGASTVFRGLRESLIAVMRQAEDARRNGSGMSGLATGFTDLDALLGGLNRSDLIILGARPSMGKTSLLINIAQEVARRHIEGMSNGAPVAVFSLEMSAEQLTQRILSSAAHVSTQHMANGTLSDSDLTRITLAANQLAELPLYIDDTPGLSIAALRSRARGMKRKYGIGLIIIDYLQLMTAPSQRADQNRVQEISQISQGLKHIARELDIPVMAASQLSRQLENRDNKRPQLSDLRESGSIEQDADLVWFLYRADYYLSKQIGAGDESLAANDKDRQALIEAKERLASITGLTELLISKNRKGPTDTINLHFNGKTTTFHNYSGRTAQGH